MRAEVAGENRIYALSRFRNPKITAEQFTIPEGFDISKEVDLSLGIWHNTGDPKEYELLFDSSLANYILEREWHKGEQWLLPPSLDELVPQNHFVRIVSKTT